VNAGVSIPVPQERVRGRQIKTPCSFCFRAGTPAGVFLTLPVCRGAISSFSPQPTFISWLTSVRRASRGQRSVALLRLERGWFDIALNSQCSASCSFWGYSLVLSMPHLRSIPNRSCLETCIFKVINRYFLMYPPVFPVYQYLLDCLYL